MNVNPSATALVSWKVKSFVKLWMLTGVRSSKSSSHLPATLSVGQPQARHYGCGTKPKPEPGPEPEEDTDEQAH